MNSKVQISGHLKSPRLQPPLLYFSQRLILSLDVRLEEEVFMVPGKQRQLYLYYSLRAMQLSAQFLTCLPIQQKIIKINVTQCKKIINLELTVLTFILLYHQIKSFLQENDKPKVGTFYTPQQIQQYMKNKLSGSQPQEIQAYKITINTTAFQAQKSSLKERTKKEYLPQYWAKFKMDRKKIVPSREDRLIKLTTRQIDRIIDMEKIRSLLYDKKRRVKQQYFEHDTLDPTTHSNVYQANFLAKINEIAIRRNIKPECQVVDEFTEHKQNKLKDKDKGLGRSVRFNKDSLTNTHRTAGKGSKKDEEPSDQKSIGSIQDDLQQFEEKLEDKKRRGSVKTQYRKTVKAQYKLLPSNRWFYGMSTHFLDKNQPRESVSKSECYRSSYDIESERKGVDSGTSNKQSFRRTQCSNRTSTKAKLQPKITEPFSQFRTSRLITIE